MSALLPLACARARLVHVPVNPLLKHRQAAHILADSGASLLVSGEARLATFEPGELGCPAVAEGERAAMLAGEARMAPSAALPDVLAALLYTSGSTGRPKGVMLSHANLWLGAVGVAHYLGLAASDRVLGVLPLSFDYGQSQLLSTWAAGACAVPIEYLAARDVVRAVEAHAITTLAGVPPLWVQLVEAAWPPRTAFALRRLTNSGGRLPVSIVRRMRELFPAAEIHLMYGLTEAFRSTSLDPAWLDSHPDSIGTPVPFADVMASRPDGSPCDPGEEGELVHSGPLVAQGYWNDPVRTARRFRPAPALSRYPGTTVWSGDRVRQDEDGLFYFVGRDDSMIKTSGNRVSPTEVEEAAVASGAAVEAVAIGYPDARLGEAIALIVRGDGGDAALRAYLKRELPNFMQPSAILWREALPRGPNGKLDREALKRELVA
jgi:acyl-CoA ligase (AMP-forming) (exosortase A-associated)